MTPPTDREVFTLDIRVQPTDIDEQNHVNNVVYLRWVQEVAYAHWRANASTALLSQWNWVVLRHEIDYHAPAFLGDAIQALTWISPADGPRQNRYVSIRRATDQKELASSCTTWCLLDAVTGRPRRVLPEISALFGLKN